MQPRLEPWKSQFQRFHLYAHWLPAGPTPPASSLQTGGRGACRQTEANICPIFQPVSLNRRHSRSLETQSSSVHPACAGGGLQGSTSTPTAASISLRPCSQTWSSIGMSPWQPVAQQSGGLRVALTNTVRQSDGAGTKQSRSLKSLQNSGQVAGLTPNHQCFLQKCGNSTQLIHPPPRSFLNGNDGRFHV